MRGRREGREWYRGLGKGEGKEGKWEKGERRKGG